MTRTFLTIIILLVVGIGKSQDISIANEKMNIFYKGIANPISFAANGVSKKSLIIKANNGTISKDYGYYTFRPDSIGKAEIIVYKKVQGKLKEVGRKAFRVKAIPDPITKVGPSAGGRIVTAVLKAQQYIRADIENFDIHVRIPIDSFTICITRGDSCYYKELQNFGNKFNDEIVNELSKIQKGDTVIFKNIFGRNVYGELKEFNSLVFFCY
jgi:hypothetical protein